MQADLVRTPLGIVGVRTHTRCHAPRRNKQTQRIALQEKESYRWAALIDDVASRMGRCAEVVHLLDREADNYLLLAHLMEHGRRFVVRATHKRQVTDQEGHRQPLADALATLEGVFERQVPLSARLAPKRPKPSRRRNLPRQMRLARLSYAATTLTLHKPKTKTPAPPNLTVHVVHVRELGTPQGAEPVDWVLYTTEPVATRKDIERVVDLYRARWRIEELFKALKTGCALEKRQLESLSTLLKALAIFLPMACDLLALRALGLADPERPAWQVLDPMVMHVLERHPRSKLAPHASIGQAMWAVARFGGHIRNNGTPGWMVLGRGYEKILILADGLRLGMERVWG